LPALYQAEQAALSHCTMVAQRLELGRCSVSLLEVACHADAALEDLPMLAERRNISLTRVGLAIGRLGTSLRTFMVDVVLDTLGNYRTTLEDMRRGLDVAGRLKVAADSAGDDVLAGWCALYVAQRGPMIDRITRELAAAA
jgi:hypothetical protein